MTTLSVTESVKADLDARTAKGIAEYGVPLEWAGLSEREILQHAYEEALDLAQYLKTRMMEIDRVDEIKHVCGLHGYWYAVEHGAPRCPACEAWNGTQGEPNA